MSRKNFQNENSCHDMDVAKVRKMQKIFSLSRNVGHGYGAVAQASHWTEKRME